jgi:sulfide:quinone oxidoreductase
VSERVLILGAGFGGLELATVLSEELGADAGVTLVEAGDAFVFGYSKLDILFGRAESDAVRVSYSALSKPGVRLLRERVLAIDPEARSVTTDRGRYDADVLVVALGAGYDVNSTPGVSGSEFYSVPGAERLRSSVEGFTSGRAVVGVCGAPFKCPPAPSEAALLLHDALVERGVRAACEITVVMPFPTPVPPAPDASAALLSAFAERGIEFVAERRPVSYDAGERVVVLDDGAARACDLLLGVPRHRAPSVVLESGLAEDGFVPVDSRTLETRFPGVFAVGDVATVGVPKAGVLAEREARVVAANIVARRRGDEPAARFDGRGSCFVEFGRGRVGRIDVDFLSGPKPTGALVGPSAELAEEKREFGASRAARWLGG